MVWRCEVEMGYRWLLEVVRGWSRRLLGGGTMEVLRGSQRQREGYWIVAGVDEL